LIWRGAVSITSWMAIALIIASGVLATRITAQAAPAAAPPA